MESKTKKVIIFASGHTRAQWVTIFLAVIILVDFIAVIFDYLEIQLVNRALAGEIITEQEAIANDSRQSSIGSAYLILYIITGILFLMWIHRAHRNLTSLGVEGLQYSPGWAVGGFFVPFLNLVRPFLVVTEIWEASDHTVGIDDGTAWEKAQTSPVIISWWLLFLITGILGSIIFRVALQTETLEEMLTTSWLYMSMDALDIPAAILAIIVVRNIDNRQETKNKLIASRITS